MLSSSKKLKDLALSLPFVPSSDASVEYGGALLLYSQLKRIKTRIWGPVPELLLGQKPKSIDANLLLLLFSLRYSPAPSALCICPYISTASFGIWGGGNNDKGG